MNTYQFDCAAYFGSKWTFYVKPANKTNVLNKCKENMRIKGNMKLDTLRVIKKVQT